jgi:hypothetical protein
MRRSLPHSPLFCPFSHSLTCCPSPLSFSFVFSRHLLLLLLLLPSPLLSLSSGFVCYSAELPVTQSSAAAATSPSGGTLSQISEEISRTEPEPTATAPSVNSSGTNEPETSGDPTAAATPKKSKGIADFVSAKMIGHKLKESLGLKHTATEDPQTPSSESPAATSPAEAVKRDEEQLTLERERKEREEKANCQLTVVVTRGELLNSHPSYEVLTPSHRPLVSPFLSLALSLLATTSLSLSLPCFSFSLLCLCHCPTL